MVTHSLHVRTENKIGKRRSRRKKNEKETNNRILNTQQSSIGKELKIQNPIPFQIHINYSNTEHEAKNECVRMCVRVRDDEIDFVCVFNEI